MLGVFYVATRFCRSLIIFLSPDESDKTNDYKPVKSPARVSHFQSFFGKYMCMMCDGLRENAPKGDDFTRAPVPAEIYIF